MHTMYYPLHPDEESTLVVMAFGAAAVWGGKASLQVVDVKGFQTPAFRISAEKKKKIALPSSCLNAVSY
jgi:hypothetical protein